MAPPVKKLLAISWAMPPMLYPRSIQVSRILSALAKIGWEITVICNDPQNSSGNDATLSSLYDASYRKINVFPDLSKQADALMSLWLEPALQSARAEIKSNEYFALITFAQPWVDHLIGLELYKETKIPWIAHFSDPWVNSPYYAGMDARQLDEWKDLERDVVSNSSAVIFTNSQAMQLVMGKYPLHWKRKSHVVPHTFDADLARRLQEEFPVKDSRLRMIYTGDLYGERSAACLFKALSDLSKQRPLAKELSIQFIGHIAENEKKMVEELGLGNMVVFHNQLPYLKSLQASAACDVLLLIDAPSSKPSPFLPSKLMDYLMFAKPIFGLTSNEGASADLLRRLECTIAPSDDVPSITKALIALLDHERAGTLKVVDTFDNVASAYHSHNVVLSLDKILHEVAATPSKFRGSTDNPGEIKYSTKTDRGDMAMNSLVPLICNDHEKTLYVSGEYLICDSGCHYQILNDIPRFVPISNYSSSFGLQWNTFRATQLDSYTGLSISRDRLTRIAGGSLDIFRGKTILEAGCGAGRFTEIMLDAGAEVFAIDLSSAVDANFQNNGLHPNVFICQADLRTLPVSPEHFDIVVCIGVIQHTPSPEETIQALCSHIKPGGELLIDHYTQGYPITPIRRWLWSYLLNKPEDYSMRFVHWLVRLLWPLHRLVYRFRNSIGKEGRLRFLLHWSPVVDYHYSYPQLSKKMLYEWAILDTHDTLTDRYKHLRSAEEIEASLRTNGMVKIETAYAGNGIEARAWKPE